jgi:hypothetical protein
LQQNEKGHKIHVKLIAAQDVGDVVDFPVPYQTEKIHQYHCKMPSAHSQAEDVKEQV